jgi:hypothetical protein
MAYVHGTQTADVYRREVFPGVGWAYLGEVPKDLKFNATFQYAS